MTHNDKTAVNRCKFSADFKRLGTCGKINFEHDITSRALSSLIPRAGLLITAHIPQDWVAPAVSKSITKSVCIVLNY